MPLPLRRPSGRSLTVVAVVLALVIVFVVRARLGTRVETVSVQREDLVQSVVSTGRVIATARIELGTQVAGTVARVLVEEGDRVAAGQLLVQLVDDEARAAAAQARAVHDEAVARIRQLGITGLPVAEQARRQAEADVVLARNEYQRVSELAAQGFFSAAKLDEAKRNIDSAEARLRSARTQADASRPAGSDHALVVARAEQARRAVEAASAKLDWTRITAPVAGVVLKRRAEPGDVAPAGTRLVALGAGALQLALLVDEKNVGWLQVGQRASAVADAYPDKPFEARILRIAPEVDAQRGTVEVKLAIDAPPGFLKPDMTVSGELVVAKRAGVLTLPAEVLRDAAGAQPWVLVARDGLAVRQPLKLGLRGSGRVEIVSGLSAGDAVVGPEQAAIKDGTRIRAVAPAPPAARKPGLQDGGALSR
jgi:HlyD family secretion protein